MSVVEVRMPSRCASTIPRFTSRVKPKSSALTTSLRTSEQAELDAQKLLGVGAEILHQAVNLARGAVEVLIQRRIHQQLPERALPIVNLVEQRVQAANGGLKLIMQIVAAEQLAGGAFALLEAAQYPAQVANGGARVVVKSGVLHQLSDGPIAFLDAVSKIVHATQCAAKVRVKAVVMHELAERTFLGVQGSDHPVGFIDNANYFLVQLIIREQLADDPV